MQSPAPVKIDLVFHSKTFKNQKNHKEMSQRKSYPVSKNYVG